ncbi:carbamoyltransferase HypF [Clostridium sp. MB40-C1]|uniref:carbamoyltransferase HypF n=1 Tax=Clostridium sp. MB40-C1 TaxID=3070996 RepID=UPI0027E1EECB|nr:carbamoyltransferase HypF [Clostridium sp. MB40-C1]WMJ80207.1 carbamoyltransferase HypF [Clostridium sp. MB40-C1]
MKYNSIGYLVKIYGIVQGIGFRPYIYKKAKELNIKGWVNNCDSSVIINAEGMRDKMERFLIDVVEKPPELAKIKQIEVIEKRVEGYKDFVIKKSRSSNTKLKFILPDIGICDKCVQDIFNKKSNRYRYAFTNCTLCGPRYSIIKSLPYDRCNTTMSEFKMCSICDKEYKNPETRRFHAQPTCCVGCGPELILTDNLGMKIQCLDEIKQSAELLKKGRILGIKGIGGFHIVCSAINEKAISEVRRRKRRKDKPLALMMKDIKQVKQYCFLSKKEEEILINNKRPIVILREKNSGQLAFNIAPRIKKYGVMLPYTPIHYLLFDEGLPPLVMTSGNVSGRPIEYTNEGALRNLSNIVDYFLLNNRDINTPVDDSVVKVLEEKVIVSRLGRGYAPYNIDRKIKNNILACGAEEKSTFSFSLDGIAYMSQYLGDLKELGAYKEYKKAINNMKNIFEFEPEIISVDAHPNYMSTTYGNGEKGIKVQIQHHHAHMASCMLEHNISDHVIGIIYDGTGFGTDGMLWGGEFLIGNKHEFKRAGHFKYTKIQGGDSAQKDIWKIGLSYLKSLDNKELIQFGLKRIKRFLKEDIDKETMENVCRALDCNINCYKTSSLGRLYDAVSSILGVRERITYDGQGAIELESVAKENVYGKYDYVIKKEDDVYIVDYVPVIMSILQEIEEEKEVSDISSKFHNTIADITVEMVCKLREDFKINKVVLSGGVFENEYLLKNTYINLIDKGFLVFFNENIPTNDSGISLGQVAIADEILKERSL